MIGYWIFDKEESPQRFPLQRLLRHVHAFFKPYTTKCELLRAWGYGEQIVALEEQLENQETIWVEYSDLEMLSAGNEEWFYDVRIRMSGLEFGLHDSTALFVEAEDENFLKKITSSFEHTRRYDR